MTWPKIGDELAFQQEDGSEIDLTVHLVRPDCAMLEVMDVNGECGSVIIHKSGAWWWLKRIEPQAPWLASLGNRNAWRGDLQ